MCHRSREYADLFLNDWTLGIDLPKEAFYFKANNSKWVVIDNTGDRLTNYEFSSELACMAYFIEDMETLIKEINFIKEIKTWKK